MMLGKCFEGCTREHTTIPDDWAKKVVEKLRPVIQETYNGTERRHQDGRSGGRWPPSRITTVAKVELLEETDSKSVNENKQWVNVPNVVFSVKTRPVMEREISTKTRHERKKLNLTSTIKTERKILHKERKIWNKTNIVMVEKPYGNLNRKSIIGL